MRDLIRPWNFGVALLLGAMGAAAGTVMVPNSFTAGTPAKAADVNADFAAVATGFNSNTDAIATLQTTVKNIPASQGPTGPQGPAGPAGAAGQTGPQGVQGPTGTGTMLVKDITGKLVGSYFVAPYDPIVPNNASSQPAIRYEFLCSYGRALVSPSPYASPPRKLAQASITQCHFCRPIAAAKRT